MRPGRDLPISARLALLTGAAYLALLLVVGAIVYRELGARLRDNLDQTLAATATGVQQQLADAATEDDPADVVEERTEAGRDAEGTVQIIAADGALVAASDTAIGLPVLLSGADLAGVVAGGTLRATATTEVMRLRLVAVPGSGDVVVVAADASPIADAQRELLATYGPVALVATALACLLGYVIARRGLAPIARMAAETEAIGHDGTRRERLTLPPRRDEVHELGRTLNGMLDRLDDAMARERAFTADASHELRTPLAIVRTELDLAGHKMPPAVRASIDSAAEEVDHMAALVDDLLLLARADADRVGETQQLDLGEVVADVVRRFKPLAERQGIALAVHGDAVVPGDERAVRRAVTNLLDNAVRHAPPGGTVEVGVEDLGVGARIAVADSGPGVDEAQLPHLFERFTRVDGARNLPGGAGLGLAIVAAVAAAHGGAVRAANRPEGGLQVALDLGTTVPPG